MAHPGALIRRAFLPLLTVCAVVIFYTAINRGGLKGGLTEPASAQAISPSRTSPDQLRPSVLARAPIVRILRDDRVATLEMDYNARSPSASFGRCRVRPTTTRASWSSGGRRRRPSQIPPMRSRFASEGLCMSAPTLAATTPLKLSTTPLALVDLPLGARWLVTGNRRVQLQPLDNDRAYRVRVQRLSARGKINSRAAELSFNGGDNARVAALRSSLTYFDDFNLPEGAADELLWNNANSVSTDPRFNLFFINDQYHSHTLHGTRHENTGDRSQTSQRFRKKIRIEPDARRRIVFDMDTPLSPRSVWYLDLNPIPTELTGHLEFLRRGWLDRPAGRRASPAVAGPDA